MIVAHVISDAVLALVSLLAFIRFPGKLSTYHRMLWGLFMLTVALAALFGSLHFAGIAWAYPVSAALQAFAGSVGAITLLVVTWALVSGREVSVELVLGTFLAGIVVFSAMLLLRNPVIAWGVQGLTTLSMIGLSVWALIRVTRKATWLLAGLLLIVTATGVLLLGLDHTPLHPIDAYHYLMAAGLFCLGEGVRQVAATRQSVGR